MDPGLSNRQRAGPGNREVGSGQTVNDIPSDAFKFYFSLGAERSYQSVAEKYQVSKRSVTSLAKREDWQQRILDLERKARAASDQKKLESLEERNERHLTALRFIGP